MDKLQMKQNEMSNKLIYELIIVFVPVVCQKSLFQSISLKVAISVPLVSFS
ncbi:hypothetical protein Hanom_Chr15g01349791 [Helianthus anomalus]